MIAQRASAGVARLAMDRQRAADRLTELAHELNQLDDDAGVDLVGLRHRFNDLLSRIVSLDERIADSGRLDGERPVTVSYLPSKGRLPVTAEEELGAARQALAMLCRVLAFTPAGCPTAMRILQAGIVEQLKRIARAKRELDRHLGR